DALPISRDEHLCAGDLLRLGMAPTVAVDGGLQLGITASGAALLGQGSAEEILDLPTAPDDGIGLDPIDHLIEALGGVLVHRQSGDELRSTDRKSTRL